MNKTSIIALIILTISLPLFIKARGFLMASPRPIIETVAAYPEPEFAKVMFLGFDAFSADILTARAQYYYGSHFFTDRNYPLLEQMINVIITLNPSIPYILTFGESAISSQGTRESIESANRILDLGEKMFPEDYEFVFRKGFNYYFYLQDYEKAYPYLYRGSRMKGAPEQYYWLVTKVMTKGGAYKLGYEISREQYNQAKDPRMRQGIAERMQTFADLIFLSDATEAYREKTGKAPDKELSALIKAGIITEIPKEPFGGVYYYNEEKGLVETSTEMMRQQPKPKDTRK